MPTASIPTAPVIRSLLSDGFLHLGEIVRHQHKRLDPLLLARVELDGHMRKDPRLVYFNDTSYLTFTTASGGRQRIQGIHVWTEYEPPFYSLGENTHVLSARHSQSEGLFVPFTIMQEPESTGEVPAIYMYKKYRP